MIWNSKVVLFACAVCAPMLFSASLRAQQNVLAKTPPMGWNSWNHFACKISDSIVRAQADAMVSSGMKAAGYEYVNIDDCWEGERDAHGRIQPNEHFPDMKALADYVHSKGLKLGIYTTPGPKTCAKHEGSYGHEEQDAQSYAEWGVDFLKYDWCSARDVYKPADSEAAIKKMADALARAGRPIVYSIHAKTDQWKWGAAAGANLWRTSGDIKDDYSRMLTIGFGEAGLESFAGPGHWNDPDMLEIGNGGMKPNEYRLHMSLWCLLAAPLIAGNDLTKMDEETKAILTNPDLIAIDQDPAGVQGHRVYEQGQVEVWMKPLADGTKAVGLFNREQGVVKVKLNLADIGIHDSAAVRDVWERKDLGRFSGSFSADVEEHSVVLLRIK